MTTSQPGARFPGRTAGVVAAVLGAVVAGAVLGACSSSTTASTTTTTAASASTTLSLVSPWGDGPAMTSPVATWNSEPWQGQTMRSAALENETVQPACGQTAS